MNSLFFGTLTTSRAARPSSGGGGAPSLIANVGTGGTPNGVTSSSINTAGANFIIINVAYYIAGSANITVTDSYTNTWSPLTLHGVLGSDNAGQKFFYCFNPTVGAGHTFSADAVNSYPSVQVAAFSNLSSSPFDLENGNSVEYVNWTTIQPGTITPSQANTIVFVGLSRDANSNGLISINDGYTITNSVDHSISNHLGGSLAYQIFTSASAQNPTWTSANLCNRGTAGIASFKY